MPGLVATNVTGGTTDSLHVVEYIQHSMYIILVIAPVLNQLGVHTRDAYYGNRTYIFIILGLAS